MGRVPVENRKRLIVAFGIFCFFLLILCFRTGYIQIVKSSEYTKMAIEQQTRDEVVEAKRGEILDRNGNVFATSTITYSVWVRPALINTSEDSVINDKNMDVVVDGLVDILGVDEEELREDLSQDITLIKVAKYQDKETADAIREWCGENNIDGISISEESKRYYPLDDLAAQVLGSVTDDGNGLAGLELYYNSYLSGVAGRWIQEKDASGNTLAYGNQEYFDPQDGANVVLTLDIVVQTYAQQECEKRMEEQHADRVSCIVMETETGEILAMASTPSYDCNNPREPMDEAAREAFDAMTPDEQLDYLNTMWRNPLVNDTYVPGSTMKLITTSMALEEDLSTVNESFYDSGSIDVYGTELKCWSWREPHGQETLREAVRNSCNPVFVQLALRIGEDTFYNYLDLFGYSHQTGIDYPGEAVSILQNKMTAGPVGLATMGYGQGIAVTPIAQITAINALANGGMLMEPHLVKQIVDDNGNIIENFEPVKVRQTVSNSTASQVLDIMGFVVEDGGAGQERAQGYRVGGKTGTSNVEAHNNMIVASFVGVAPLDDPKITVLFIVENPKEAIYGSTVAAPGGMKVIENTLKYLGVDATEEIPTTEEDKVYVSTPNVTNMKLEQARGYLSDKGLTYIISPAVDNEDEFTIVDQYPKAGTEIEKGGVVYLYSK